MGWLSTGFKPVGPRVLVKLDGPATSYGSIIIPDNLTYQPVTGTVVAVSDGFNRRTKDKRTGRYEYEAQRSRIDIEPGATVCFGKYNGIRLDPPDDDPTGEYWVMDVEPMQNDFFADVYGVVERDGAP